MGVFTAAEHVANISSDVKCFHCFSSGRTYMVHSGTILTLQMFALILSIYEWTYSKK